MLTTARLPCGGGRNVNASQGDSGMSRIILLALFSLQTFSVPVLASWSEEHLELSNVQETIDEYGLAVFSGELRNTHTMRPIASIFIFIVLKKEGRIVGMEYFIPRDAWAKLDPLGTVSFEHETLYAPEEYDEFSVRAEGTLQPPDQALVVGEVYLVEESFNIVNDTVYGEIRNDTNAIISYILLEIDLLDARGDLISTLKSRNIDRIALTEIGAGDTVGFILHYVDLARHVPKIKDKEVRISWGIVDIVAGEPIATAVEQASWGQIKQQKGGRYSKETFK